MDEMVNSFERWVGIDPNLILKLAKEYGNSLYILDLGIFRQNYTDLLASFRRYYENTNIAYSYKTNYIPTICKEVNKLGGYAEVVSELELSLALKCGVVPHRIIWNGPVKDADNELFYIRQGCTVNIDSTSEFDRLIEFTHNEDLSVGIRCNFYVGDGKNSRFGVDIDHFKYILNCLKNTSIKISTLHVHFADRSPRYWQERVRGMMDFVDVMHAELGYFPQRIDLGGGILGRMPECLREQLGVDRVTYDDYAASVSEFNRIPENERPELLIEPGTALVSDTMMYVCGVHSIKEYSDRTVVSVTGSQKNISMIGINPPMVVFNMHENHNRLRNADIVGYTCIEGDVLCKGYEGELSEGDYVGFCNCGSYSVVLKPPFINAMVPVLEIDGNSISEIKRKETFEDVFATYVI